MNSLPEGPDQSERRADRHESDDRDLTTGQRVVCTAVALTSGAAGGAGVFIENTNSAGVPVLLGIGALFGYLAVSGQRLTRLKFGDNEAAFGQSVRRILRDPEISDRAKAEVAEHLDDEQIPLPPSAKYVINAVLEDRRLSDAYQREVSAALVRAIGSEHGFGPTGDDFDDDAVVFNGPESGVIGIAVKWFEQPVGEVELFRTVRSASRSAQFGMLVINQESPVQSFNFDVRGRLAAWAIVTWRTPNDDSALFEAYRQQVNLSSDESRKRRASQ